MIRAILGALFILAALTNSVLPPQETIHVVILGCLLWAWDDISQVHESLINADIVLEKKLNELLKEKSK